MAPPDHSKCSEDNLRDLTLGFRSDLLGVADQNTLGHHFEPHGIQADFQRFEFSWMLSNAGFQTAIRLSELLGKPNC